jgi:exodeoxyribonuclease V beta subunit
MKNTFEVEKVPLNGSNIIEASAGTGKTFSIAILTLRLLLEKKMPVEKILLVTFTEAAAAELKERSVKFIRLALKEIQLLGSGENKAIESIVSNCILADEEKKTLLNKALLDIDKATMTTIHSFCQQTLTEFAFETGQMYGKTLHTNIDAIVDYELQKYWRTNISVIDVENLTEKHKFSLFSKAVKMALDGLSFSTTEVPDYIAIQQQLAHCIQEVKSGVLANLQKNNIITFNDLITDLHSKRNDEQLKKVLRRKYDAVFVDEFQDTDKNQYEIFSSIFQEDKSKIVFYIGDPKQSIYAWRKADLKTYFEAKKNVQSNWTMNTNFRSSAEYVNTMNAFFVQTDDFHPFSYNLAGVDKIDYEEVQAATQSSGDPGLKDDEGALKPIIIDQSGGNTNITLLHRVKYLLSSKVTLGGRLVKPSDIGILVRKNKEGRAIKNILDKAKIPSVVVDETSVFDSAEANDLKELLNAVLNTSKNHIDRALLTNVAGMNCNGLLEVDYDELVLKFKELKKLWEDSGIFVVTKKLFDLFGIEERWKSHPTTGHRVLSNLRQLIEILQTEAQNRTLTPTEQFNFLSKQLKSEDRDGNEEYAQRVESDEEAIKIVTIHKSKGLEYNIVLLPALEMPNKPIWQHVFFRFKQNNQDAFVLYHNGSPKGNYTAWTNQAINDTEDENRRLIYVAITRARFNSFIFCSPPKYIKNGNRAASFGSIHYYLEALEKCNLTARFTEQNPNRCSNFESRALFTPNESLGNPLLSFPQKNLPDQNYHKMSYSFLAAKHGKSEKENGTAYTVESYDHFIFKELQKGSQTGNLLHDIFEFSDFQNPEEWPVRIEQSIRRLAPGKIGDANFAAQLLSMVNHVLYANIRVGNDEIQLSKLSKTKRISELEFNFPIPKTFQIADLSNVFQNSDLKISTNYGEVFGMMNGLVDLFFEYNGKYYILDWKSNFLGDTVEHYTKEQLNDAMNESNYHLQYCIYTVAMKQFLESKIANFDYESQFGGVIYLFLRGMRKGLESGVFTCKLSLGVVEEFEGILRISNNSKVS